MTELLLIDEERIGPHDTVVIRPEELKEFADDLNGVFAVDGYEGPPLEFREVDFRFHEQCNLDPNGPVYAVAFQCLKSEAADLLRWHDVELVDGEGRTKTLDDKLFRDLKAEISRDYSWRSHSGPDDIYGYERDVETQEQIEEAESWEELEAYAPMEWSAAVASRCHRNSL